jgi:alkanesulfonate monooxygenase SsuD/methylene tetrahydromethanopterin reductase-like flavin-dependent oxidoreductase (luciferase family)
MQVGIMMRTGTTLAAGVPVGSNTPLRWTDLREMATLAEHVGVDTLCAPDHLLFRNAPPEVNLPEGETRGIWEVFTLLTALAASTKRVTLLPFVACTSFRNPALLAKIADTVDEVSGGRLILGLGAGWHAPEYKAYGYPYDRRVSRFEEALQIIVPLLKGEQVTFHGQFYDVEDVVLVPRGPRPAGIPIWIGARRPRMLGLVAKYADAYNTDQLLDVSSTKAADDLFQIADDACRTAGRDPSTLMRTSGISIALEDAEETVGGLPSVILRGSNQEMIDKLAAYAASGVKHMTFWVYPWSLKGIERLAPIVEAAHRM